LVALFGMLILSAVVDIGTEYDMDTTEVVGGAMSLDEFNDSISSIEDNAQVLKAIFEEQSIWNTIAGVVVEGIFGIALTMILMIFSPFTLIKNISEDVLHVPVYVTSVIFGLLIFSIIFSIWRILKIGD